MKSNCISVYSIHTSGKHSAGAVPDQTDCHLLNVISVILYFDIITTKTTFEQFHSCHAMLAGPYKGLFNLYAFPVYLIIPKIHILHKLMADISIKYQPERYEKCLAEESGNAIDG